MLVLYYIWYDIISLYIIISSGFCHLYFNDIYNTTRYWLGDNTRRVHFTPTMAAHVHVAYGHLPVSILLLLGKKHSHTQISKMKRR